MNDIESFAVFDTDFPDDSVEDANGDIITAAGRNIMAAICNQIGSVGVVITQPEKHSFHAWASLLY